MRHEHRGGGASWLAGDGIKDRVTAHDVRCVRAIEEINDRPTPKCDGDVFKSYRNKTSKLIGALSVLLDPLGLDRVTGPDGDQRMRARDVTRDAPAMSGARLDQRPDPTPLRG